MGFLPITFISFFILNYRMSLFKVGSPGYKRILIKGESVYSIIETARGKLSLPEDVTYKVILFFLQFV